MKISRFLIPIVLCALTGCVSSSWQVERSLTMSAKPKFKTYKEMDFSVLLLKRHGIDYDPIWPSEAPKPKCLNPASTYTYDLLIKKRPFGPDHDVIYTTTLVRLRQHKDILYDGSICPVHHLPMKRKLVPISYGYPFFNDAFFKVWDIQFPNIGFTIGGCCVDPDNKTSFEWICPECCLVFEKWKTTHKSSPYASTSLHSSEPITSTLTPY